jgi:citrate lyase beta subunit
LPKLKRGLSPLQDLQRANARVAREFPGDSGARQPIHSVYGGAHLFTPHIAQKLGARALATLDAHAPTPDVLARVLGLDQEGDATFAATVRDRIVAKLRREPVEDYRIDFEDGYGHRPDAEEDGHARTVAEAVAAGHDAGTLPPFIGIRIKPLSRELQSRSLRTLEIFVRTLARATSGSLPENFVITIPKLMAIEHVRVVADTCASLERRLKLRRNRLRLELMIETPQSILAADGTSPLRALVAAGAGRVRGAHFGTYDYTALCGITASWQRMRHPACDYARHMMQVALAQSGVFLSDGATNVLPIAPDVHRAWKLHYDDIRHSLMCGFYQGWDLHPAQLPTRYAAVYAFFLSARPAATARLRNFVDKAAQATLVGDVFDDAATGQGLLNFFVRGLSSGALTMAEAAETGLTPEELQGRSFIRILDARKRR